jgi:hypothetical protein
MDFGRKKPNALFKAVHDTSNPLNWFERMRLKQREKPESSNVALAHRTLETRQQAMVAKSGSGDQRALGKLAAMDPVEYYKKNSGLLTLSRSDPVLIKKIRESSVPDNGISTMASETAETVLGAPPEGSPEAPEGEASPSEGPSVGGGGSAAAAAAAVPPLATSKKELDTMLTKSREEGAEAMKNVSDVYLNLAMDRALDPFRSGNKEAVRDGMNYFMEQVTKMAEIVKEKDPKAPFTWPSNIEVRKTTNAGKIGRLFIDGQDIKAYVERNKEDPGLVDRLSRVGSVFDVVRNALKAEREKRGPLLATMSDAEVMTYMDREYPLLRDAFGSLQKQIDDSLKSIRPKRPGGRPKGVKNKKSAMVTTALAMSGGTDADTEGVDEESS